MESSKKTFSWKGKTLDEYRKIMDPAADKAIASVYHAEASHQLRDLLKNMAQNDSFAPADMPPDIRDFINSELKMKFSEYDIAMFEKAHKIWKENGVQFIFILFFRALPYTYMAEKPANVLRMTKLLESHPTRRIFETAQFVFDVMDNNWWEPGKRGLMTALKVRLMHAAMRYNILNQPADEKWNMDWGLPISQEDLIATNQVFSLEFFKGMEMIGQPLSASDQEAWFHTWKTIGKIMGIQDELLSANVEEAWKLQKEVYNHLFPDDNRSGVALAQALVHTLSEFMLSTKHVLLIMRKMILDQEHPDLFYRVLGPSYGQKFPSVFMKTRSADEADAHNEILHKEFYEELMEFKNRVKDYQEEKKKSQPATRGTETKKNLIDYQLEEFEELLVQMDPEGPATRGLKEELFKRAMASIGGVIIGVLSSYFRLGKQSGFRIPENLKEHWALD
jgi:hypothetical protein